MTTDNRTPIRLSALITDSGDWRKVIEQLTAVVYYPGSRHASGAAGAAL
jgi:hypothetical protein